jgi:hypothetical protein
MEAKNDPLSRTNRVTRTDNNRPVDSFPDEVSGLDRLYQWEQDRHRRNKFTLTELLVTVVIIVAGLFVVFCVKSR